MSDNENKVKTNRLGGGNHAWEETYKGERNKSIENGQKVVDKISLNKR